jgi:hypothetical protein
MALSPNENRHQRTGQKLEQHKERGNIREQLDDGCKPKGWIEAGGADYLPERNKRALKGHFCCNAVGRR